MLLRKRRSCFSDRLKGCQEQQNDSVCCCWMKVKYTLMIRVLSIIRLMKRIQCFLMHRIVFCLCFSPFIIFIPIIFQCSCTGMKQRIEWKIIHVFAFVDV